MYLLKCQNNALTHTVTRLSCRLYFSLCLSYLLLSNQPAFLISCLLFFLLYLSHLGLCVVSMFVFNASLPAVKALAINIYIYNYVVYIDAPSL